MAKAEIEEVIPVDAAKFFETVTRYEEYPKFVDGCKKVHVERKGPGHARVTYDVSMIKDISYTLDHHEDPAKGVIEWTLVKSDFLKANHGRWEIAPSGEGKSKIRYALEVEFKIPVPSLILGRLVKGNLPSMVKSFVQKAQRG